MGKLKNIGSDSGHQSRFSEAVEYYHFAVETMGSASNAVLVSDASQPGVGIAVPNRRTRRALEQMQRDELNQYSSLDELRRDVDV